MAIEPVAKVLVAVHDSSRERFYQQLQRLGVMHVTRAEAAAEAVAAGDRELDRIVAAIEFLAARAGRKSRVRPVLTREEFEQAAGSDDHRVTLAQLEQANAELAEVENRLRQVTAEQQRLRPWRSLEHDIAEVYGLGTVQAQFVRFADRAECRRAEEALAGLPATVQTFGTEEAEVCALVLSRAEAGSELVTALAGIRYETVDLRGVSGRPRDLLAKLADEERRLAARRTTLQEQTAVLAGELPRLKVAADLMKREAARREAEAAAARTTSVHLVQGWVRRRDLARLTRLVEQTEAAVLTEIPPSEGEEPPVALVNRPVFRPFEMVIELFSMPSPGELDPTWLIAPFFGVFFGLCLTDAGYGLVVVALALVLLRRMGWNNKLLGIVLIGGILTIPAGALVGGWFGDVPDRLGLAWLLRFKNSLMWFDPMRDPMKFFVLSVALGYLQMICGIAFEIADCLRVRNWGDGLLGQLPWFVLLNGLTARVVFARVLPAAVGAGLVVAVLAAVAAIIVFTQRSKETMAAQWLWFGLLAASFTVLAGRFRWGPPQLLHAWWAAVGFHAAVLAMAAVSLFRAGRPGPVPLALGALALTGFGLYLARLVSWPLAALSGLVFFAMSPAGRGLLAKLLWGGYALYGATSYVGVVLSYIRLMALGMCTGGVAMAVNVIVGMVLRIPVVGIPMALLVFIGGHAYNIAVNVLGAFVHSLRLQYVEFFPRFYAGGGEPFRPFREENQYTAVA